MNSPRSVWSLRKREMPAEMPILMIVTKKQNNTNLVSHASLKSTADRSLNKTSGSGTRKTNLFILSAKSSSIHPIFRRNSPSTIRRNTGTVAFKLNMRFSIFTAPPHLQILLYLGTKKPPIHRLL